MSRKQKKNLIRILVSFALLVASSVADHFLAARLPRFVILLFYLIPYAVIGWDILKRAVVNLFHGQLFDENFLMSLATVGAFAVGEYREASAVMLFYQVGELFQSCAVSKSRKSIAALMDIRPDRANVERNGELLCVPPEEVSPGEVITVRPGEKIPLDGVIVEGHTQADMSALTGESVPVPFAVGDEIASGGVNGSGLIRIRVSRPFGQSTVAKILELVESSSEKKAVTENFITKFSKIYTPAVVIGAAVLALLPPLILRGDASVWKNWIGRALTFLVISCPCALVISVPLSFFGGLGGASKCGILIKGGNYLEALAKTRTVVFDKTGTLTAGVFRVTAVRSETVGERELLRLAALAETYSDHPIAASVRDAYGESVDASAVTDVREIPGQGVAVRVGEHVVGAGNAELMRTLGAEEPPHGSEGTTVYIAVDGRYAGCVILSDQVKPNAKRAIDALKTVGVKKTVMLTGDKKEIGEKIAEELGIDEVHTRLLPRDKVEITERLLAEKEPKSTLAFVGDGINDAPVLSRADVGIAMGGIGSDAAIEAADVVLMDDDPAKLVDAIALSKRTLGIVRQNIVFSLAVKALILALGALGLANMWMAVFADVGVAVLAILNAMRALRVKRAAD